MPTRFVFLAVKSWKQNWIRPLVLPWDRISMFLEILLCLLSILFSTPQALSVPYLFARTEIPPVTWSGGDDGAAAVVGGDDGSRRRCTSGSTSKIRRTTVPFTHLFFFSRVIMSLFVVVLLVEVMVGAESRWFFLGFSGWNHGKIVEVASPGGLV
jgi:hypothetical protein